MRQYTSYSEASRKPVMQLEGKDILIVFGTTTKSIAKPIEVNSCLIIFSEKLVRNKEML